MKSIDMANLKLKIKNGKVLGGKIKRLRFEILKRDNFKCVKCGSEQELTIDHINHGSKPKRECVESWKLEDCQTLCVKCHLAKNQQLDLGIHFSLRKKPSENVKKDEEIILFTEDIEEARYVLKKTLKEQEE